MHRDALAQTILSDRSDAGPNLLVVSDLHVGEDLTGGPHATLRKIQEVTQAFTTFLSYYADARVEGRAWRLIIAGDMIDFLRARIGHALSRVDRGAPDIATRATAVAALERVMTHHRGVFDALSRFVLAGHELVILKGNHDVELHWEEVQAAFSDGVARGAPNEEARAEVLRRISFSEWFWYEPGLVYVEHGNQYDEFCSFENVLAPTLPGPGSEEKVLAEPISHLTLRNFAGLVLGKLDMHAIDRLSFMDFIRMLMTMGPRIWAQLAYTYFAGVSWLATAERRLADAVRHARDVHRARLIELAHRARLTTDVLAAIDALRHRPAGWLRGMQMMFLDQFLIAGLTIVLVLAALWLPFDAQLGPWAPHLLALAVLGGALGLMTFRARGRDVESHPKLARVARQIHGLVDVPFVVFGHSHVPVLESVGDVGRFYVNTGSWSGDARGGLTHLFIQRQSRPLAELRRWCLTTSSPVAMERGALD